MPSTIDTSNKIIFQLLNQAKRSKSQEEVYIIDKFKEKRKISFGR